MPACSASIETPLSERWILTTAPQSALARELKSIGDRLNLTFGGMNHTPQTRAAARHDLARMAILIADLQSELAK